MPERSEEAKRTPEAQVRALYEDAESRAAQAFEEAVAKPSFGAFLARSAENVAALSRIGNDAADLVLRNLRIAGRADITRLARQLHRNEDKLERVLQEVEQLRDELAQHDELARRDESSGTAAPRNGRSAASRSAASRSAASRSAASPRRSGSSKR